MKSLLLLSFMLVFGTALQAQQYQFVYLQTDNKQPFYVRINDKLYSSSAAGYLVIPKLTAGAHDLAIGFPKSEWPTQNITVPIGSKDLGFVLKRFEGSKWGLFNLQTMEVVTASGNKVEASIAADAKTDQFSNILADVVNSPSIKQNQPAVVKTTAETPKAIPETPVVKSQEEVVSNQPKIVGVAPVSNIQKLSTVNDLDGLAMVYVDKLEDRTDTIRVFIEAAPVVTPPATVQPTVEAPIVPQQAVVKAEPDPVQEDAGSPKFIDITLANPNEQPKEGKKENQPQAVGAATEKSSTADVALKPLMINSDCKQLAAESDFLKIRKKMTAENGDDDMVKAAAKMFKQKCYSTDQVKNLSVLFLNDEGKYKLFDAAYPYVHDTQFFKQLESQLTDPYIITRFRAMIRN